MHFPTTIREWQGKIFVSDEDGIKIFNQEGQLQNLLRSFYGIFNFSVADDGAIYANVSYKTPKDSDPLIVKLNNQGEKTSGFGARQNHLQYKGLDDNAYLFCAQQLLFVAFQHRPLIQIYDLKREQLVREFAVKHPAFGSLDELAKDKTFTNPSPSKTALPRYIAGVAATSDRVFVLLHLPHVEIIEFDLEGHEKNRFRSAEVSRVLNYFGFDAREVSGNYVFYVGIASLIDQEESPFLTEFFVARAG